jgi:hypothetical protein
MNIERVCHRHNKAVVVSVERNKVVAERKLTRDELQNSGVRWLFVEVNERAIKLAREYSKESRLRDVVQANQNLSKAFAVVIAPLLVESIVALLGGNDPLFHQ